MENVKGTMGYGAVVKKFVSATEAVDFEALHKPYRELIPSMPCRVLDVGAGSGRDASVFESMGHKVTAVEPLSEFLIEAKKLHNSDSIKWINDSLPKLEKLGEEDLSSFDFVLASAMWHHLDIQERILAMKRVAKLTRSGGIFALSLRNGPAGGGTHVFPTNQQDTIESAKEEGFDVVVSLTDQPSLMAGKTAVKWSMLALRRR